MSVSPVTAPQGLDAFGQWFSESFRLWSAQWQVWVLQGLILFAIAILPAILFYFIFFIGMAISSAGVQSSEPPVMLLGLLGIFYLIIFVGAVFSLFLIPGMVNTALKQMRGQRITVGDLFSAMRFGWGYFVVSFLTGLGVIACYVGAFVLMGKLFLALPLMIDKRLTTTEAISVSWYTTKTNFWLYILYAFVVMLLAQAGAIVCYIGVIATLPFVPIAQAVAYERTFNGPGAFTGPGAPSGYMPPPYQPGPQSGE